ncbi:hypothetical protein PHISP_00507 [Aspergillus sp. HF37]|nr:hypothetical protein PHISP_00507 [Aspergillus sp. HF37]
MNLVLKPVLHVEARVKTNSDGLIIRTDLVGLAQFEFLSRCSAQKIRDEVAHWLVDKFAVLSLRQEIHSFDGLKEPHAQALDSIVVTECSGEHFDSGAYRLQNVELDVQAYQLRVPVEDGFQPSQHTEESADAGEDASKAKVVTLPSKELDGLWESLQYDQPIQSTLLRAITRMVLFSARRFNKWTINWNRLILLWGPPGTGKTSFCRGLAQKLAIRLGKHYPQSKLVDINAQALGSKFYGESGKLVGKMFDNIETLLEEDDTFVCVFIDEIETLAARRERSLSGNEPFDAVRAVNALLTGLDKLRQHPNVVFICTSNLVTALDPAFLDRVDIKQHMPHLSHRTMYELYKECLEELSRCRIVEGASFDVIQVNPDDPQTPLQYVEQPAAALTLPSFDEMLLNFQMFPDAVPTRLADIASASAVSIRSMTIRRLIVRQGISGRTVRRLPALSLVLHSNRSRCDIHEALEALRGGVEGERMEQA